MQAIEYCVPEIPPPSIVIPAKAGIQIFVPLRKIMPHRFAKPCFPPRRFRPPVMPEPRVPLRMRPKMYTAGLFLIIESWIPAFARMTGK